MCPNAHLEQRTYVLLETFLAHAVFAFDHSDRSYSSDHKTHQPDHMAFQVEVQKAHEHSCVESTVWIIWRLKDVITTEKEGGRTALYNVLRGPKNMIPRCSDSGFELQ